MVENIFKFIFIALLCLLTGIRFYYKWIGHVLFESPFKKEPALTIVLRYLIGLPLFGAVFMVIIFPYVLPWMYINVPLWLRITGVVMALSGLVLLLLSHQALDGFFSMTLTIRRDHHLVVEGPYRWIRHPMYVAYLILFFSLFLVSRNWLIGVAGTGIIVVLMTARLKKEEQLLLDHFGKIYRDYATNTPRFFPIQLFKHSSQKSHVKVNTSLDG